MDWRPGPAPWRVNSVDWSGSTQNSLGMGQAEQGAGCGQQPQGAGMRTLGRLRVRLLTLAAAAAVPGLSSCSDAPRVERFDDGSIARVSRWEGPLLHGPDLRLHEDGTPDRMGSWNRGRRDGLWLDWAPTGELIRAEEWRAGLREGRHRGWTEEGQPEFMGSWADNLREGDWLTFGPGGLAAAVQTYRAGSLVGERQAEESDRTRFDARFADLVPADLAARRDALLQEVTP
jgi:hypothetical protein